MGGAGLGCRHQAHHSGYPNALFFGEIDEKRQECLDRLCNLGESALVRIT